MSLATWIEDRVGPLFREPLPEDWFWPTLEKHRAQLRDLASRQASERESEEEQLRHLPDQEAKGRRRALYRRQYGELLALLETQGADLLRADHTALHSLVLREREEVFRLMSPGGRSVIELLECEPAETHSGGEPSPPEA